MSVLVIFTLVNYFSLGWLHWVDNRRGMIDELCPVYNRSFNEFVLDTSREFPLNSRQVSQLTIPPALSLFSFSPTFCYSSQAVFFGLFSWMKKALEERSVDVDFLFMIIVPRKKRVKEKQTYFSFNEILFDWWKMFLFVCFFREIPSVCVEIFMNVFLVHLDGLWGCRSFFYEPQ